METAILKTELKNELNEILDYWISNTIDYVNGGFVGEVDNNNNIHSGSPKGSVLNARILWAFSAGYQTLQKPQYLMAAKRAFDYIKEKFIDKVFGGVYWTVDEEGKPLETKKQVYANAFILYACCEYYKISNDITAKQIAIDLYEIIQQHSYDLFYGGYFEAFSEQWGEIKDLRLSEKDNNEKKTMNTHLHILEAYSNLYSIYPDQRVLEAQENLIKIFLQKIINASGSGLHLFFDEQWNIKGKDIISYGHNIEAGWLLCEAAEIINNKHLISECKSAALQLTDAAISGIDTDGGMWYEFDAANNRLTKEKHWWPQAEAIVGFINAWQISSSQSYLQYAFNSWDFIKTYIKDKDKGEWFWGINSDYSLMADTYKVGLWKCPYHNARACTETLKRI